MDSALFNGIWAVAGIVVGSVLGSWLTSGRTRKEKLWDLKRAAYGTILSEIASIDRIHSFADAMMSENMHMYFDSAQRREHEQRIAKHWDIARGRFADDYLVLSDEFIAIFEKLIADIEADEPNEMWPEEQERISNLVHEAKPRLVERARGEIAEREIGGYTLRGCLRNVFRRFGFGFGSRG
jgi:hypothetical protein